MRILLSELCAIVTLYGGWDLKEDGKRREDKWEIAIGWLLVAIAFGAMLLNGIDIWN